MKNKLNQLLSIFSWKKILNWKALAVVPLLFSAAVYADTCPKSDSFKLDDQGHYVSTQNDNGFSWKSDDTFSAKVDGLTLNYVEIRRAEGHQSLGAPSCHYSNDPRQHARVFVTMYPSKNEIAVSQPGSQFAAVGVRINSETVSQCQAQRHDGGNCAISLTNADSAAKRGSVSPFASVQAESCEQQRDTFYSNCMNGLNPGHPADWQKVQQCKIAADAQYMNCKAGQGPTQGDDIVNRPVP